MGALRAILAVSVVLAHSGSFFGLTFTKGMVSVQVFFIISGFYMSMILSEKYIGPGSYRLFITNRMLRLFPVYWIVLLIVVLASVVSFIRSNDWASLSAYVDNIDLVSWEIVAGQVVTNLVLLGQDAAMFFGINTESGTLHFVSELAGAGASPLHKFLIVPQAWTLGIELLFYLVAPFVVRRNLFYVLGLLSLSLFVRLFIYFGLGWDHDPWTYRFFPTELALFLLGTVSYRLYKSGLNERMSSRFRDAMIAAMLGMVCFYQFIPFNRGYGSHLINWTLYLYACLVIPILFARTKDWKLDNRIGEFSYPIYISHMFVISFLSPSAVQLLSSDGYFGEISLVLTLFLSYGLIRLVSDPIERHRRGRIVRYNSS